MAQTPFEEYLISSIRLDNEKASGKISEREHQKKLNLLKINMFFPKIAMILAEDLAEQKRIDDEFGYMGGNYE